MIGSDPRYRFFDLGDFMLMAKVVRRSPRADIVLYKHSYTRHHLNLDAGGRAYRYAAPPPGSDRSGRYLAHRSLRDAMDALGLWELPWMKPSLDAHCFGLRWEERWMLHPDEDTTPIEEAGHGHLRLV